jgi:NADH:ubiquinone oxidoreductase subunit K
MIKMNFVTCTLMTKEKQQKQIERSLFALGCCGLISSPSIVIRVMLSLFLFFNSFLLMIFCFLIFSSCVFPYRFLKTHIFHISGKESWSLQSLLFVFLSHASIYFWSKFHFSFVHQMKLFSSHFENSNFKRLC